MCDPKQFETDLRKYMTRREFGALAAGAGLSLMLPRAADALDIVEADVDIETPDGIADAHFAHPASGAHAAVLVWPDILGLRPAFRQMGRRLAESGYAVLTVNPFYRVQRAPVVSEGASFADEATRGIVLPMARALTPETHVTDASAFTEWLDGQSAVDSGRGMGTTGYCMGGPMVMRTAATRPDRIAAAATFHGSRLVMDDPASPHLLIPQMKAAFLIAIAESDDERDPEAKGILTRSFDASGLAAEIEVYDGTAHGWCPPDSSVHNQPQAERAWTRLLALFDSGLAG
ncbi:dienelactone hydrolase family protein [Elongatibacter sediminis]|uniref:Dienelactone hydrolase family protein n=1 Tax=Elongatibacter sediminis TaxID=3119006 RepID=A0AAW9R9N6_9GAMM